MSTVIQSGAGRLIVAGTDVAGATTGMVSMGPESEAETAPMQGRGGVATTPYIAYGLAFAGRSGPTNDPALRAAIGTRQALSFEGVAGVGDRLSGSAIPVSVALTLDPATDVARWAARWAFDGAPASAAAPADNRPAAGAAIAYPAVGTAITWSPDTGADVDVGALWHRTLTLQMGQRVERVRVPPAAGVDTVAVTADPAADPAFQVSLIARYSADLDALRMNRTGTLVITRPAPPSWVYTIPAVCTAVAAVYERGRAAGGRLRFVSLADGVPTSLAA